MAQRTPPLKEAVRRYHDRVAGRYDEIYDDAYWVWHDALTWEYLRPYLPRDLSHPVVDLGCGTGKWGIRLLKGGIAVTFVHISGAKVERARRKVEEMGIGARATFVQGDLEELGALRGAGFALATALGEPLGSTENPGRALKEIRALLRPGGVLAATFDNRLAAIEFYLEKGDAGELAGFLRSGRTHWLTKDAEERFELWTYSPEGARELMERAHFEVLSVRGKTVLPMRRYRTMLEDPVQARKLLAIEKQLSGRADAIGRAAHVQIAARCIGRGTERE